MLFWFLNGLIARFSHIVLRKGVLYEIIRSAKIVINVLPGYFKNTFYCSESRF